MEFIPDLVKGYKNLWYYFTGFGPDLTFLRPQLDMPELQYSFSVHLHTEETNILCLFRNGLWPSDTGEALLFKQGQVGCGLSWGEFVWVLAHHLWKILQHLFKRESLTAASSRVHHCPGVSERKSPSMGSSA